MGKRGPVALWSPKPVLPYCFFTVCGGLAWVATRPATWEAQCAVAQPSSGSNEVLATHKEPRFLKPANPRCNEGQNNPTPFGHVKPHRILPASESLKTLAPPFAGE